MTSKPVTSAPTDSRRSHAATAVPPVARDVVDEQHSGAARDVVGMDLDGRRTVLEVVAQRRGASGQLPRLAHRDEADAERMRESSTDDEPACLHPGDELDVAMAGSHVGDDRSERRGVGQQRGDVLKRTPGAGKSGMSRRAPTTSSAIVRLIAVTSGSVWAGCAARSGRSGLLEPTCEPRGR